jgi:hypothetical protein
MSEPTSTSERPAFKGKTVVVSSRNRSLMAPLVLTDCTFVVVGNRLFLVGTSLAPDRSRTEWSDGVRHRIAWDAVEEYLLFDSVEEYYDRRPTPSASQAEIPVAMPGIPGMGLFPQVEYPSSDEGNPVEPSDIYVDEFTPLEIGSTVLAQWGGRWWRAEVIGLEGTDHVRVHYPGWDSKWDDTIARDQLQVDLSSSLKAEEIAEDRDKDDNDFEDS